MVSEAGIGSVLGYALSSVLLDCERVPQAGGLVMHEDEEEEQSKCRACNDH